MYINFILIIIIIIIIIRFRAYNDIRGVRANKVKEGFLFATVDWQFRTVNNELIKLLVIKESLGS